MQSASALGCTDKKIAQIHSVSDGSEVTLYDADRFMTQRFLSDAWHDASGFNPTT